MIPRRDNPHVVQALILVHNLSDEQVDKYAALMHARLLEDLKEAAKRNPEMNAADRILAVRAEPWKT